MTEQEIMRWAVESGLAEVADTAESLPADYVEALAKFAGLSAEREREACAKVCDHYAMALDHVGNEYTRSRECQQAAAAIRARNNKDNQP